MSDDLSICENAAAYRYTWPGRDEAFVCEGHSHKLRAVADAMGLHLQLIKVPLGRHSQLCQQRVS